MYWPYTMVQMTMSSFGGRHTMEIVRAAMENQGD
jgi:hypothetical protein